MNDFVTARIEYISADNGAVNRPDVRAHRITCMRNGPEKDAPPAVLSNIRINDTPIKSSANTYNFEAGTKIEGIVITSFTVDKGNFLVEYLE